MSKKIIFVFGGFIIIIIGLMIFFSRSSDKIISPIGNQTVGKKPTGEKLEKYHDEAGFEFNYPQSIKVKKEIIDDNTIYSSLKITSEKNSGSISLNVADTDYETVKDYLEGEKIASAGANLADLKLADVEAKKISQKNKDIILAIDQGVLFRIEIDYQNSKDYWQQAENTLVKTFAFVAPTSNQTSTSQELGEGESDIIDEGEEIVE